jgi:hypothetical protein
VHSAHLLDHCPLYGGFFLAGLDADTAVNRAHRGWWPRATVMAKRLAGWSRQDI